MKDIDRFDIEIMYYLYSNSMKAPLESSKIQGIIDFCESKASYYTYVNRIKKLINLGYICEGFKAGNAKCYYISKEGSKFLEDNVLNQEDIYEEE